MIAIRQKPMEHMLVRIADVMVGQRRLTVKLDNVERLAESMARVGLLNPITVRRTDDGWLLVAGLHRLNAGRHLGWETIPSSVVEGDDLAAQIAELDENLMRQELTAQERGLLLAERKRLYLEAHPDTKHGAHGGGRGGNGMRQKTENADPAFSVDAADKTGRSRTTVEQDVRIGEKISEAAHAVIAGSDLADRKGELLALTHVPEEHQVGVATRIVGGAAKTVAAAAKQVIKAQEADILARIPDPEDAHRRASIRRAYATAVRQVMQGFLTLEPASTLEVLDRDDRADLRRFFDLFREQADRWEGAMSGPMLALVGEE